MAPIRKSKNLNKLSSTDNKSPIKDACNGDKSQQKKRKASDMKESQWSKNELELFYEAYRKCGKNWKKIADHVSTRSVEMVEELYDLNKAYLSLPEGIASVVGLIAMMTDHYKSLESDGSERESSEKQKISQKRQHDESRDNNCKNSSGHSPHMLHSQTVASRYECISSLKNARSSGETRIVGKRTPRVPVSPLYNKGDTRKYNSSSIQNPGSGEDVKSGEAVQGVLSMIKAARGEGPSQTPYRETEHTRLSSVRGWGKAEAEMVNKHGCTAKGDCQEGGLGIRKAGIPDSARDCDNTVEGCRKTKRVPKLSANLKDMIFDSLETRRMNKRSKRLLSEDESSALDALTILAGEPTPSSAPEPKKDEDNDITGEEALALNVGLILGAKERVNLLTSRKKKRKGKSLSSKIPKAESAMDCLLGEQQETQPSDKSIGKPKLARRSSILLNEPKEVKPQEPVSPIEDLKRQGIRSQSMTQAPPVNQVNLPTISRNRRKMHLKKMLVPIRLKSPESMGTTDSKDSSSSLHDGAQSLKECFSHCLSSQTLQRWCAYEWFYSAMDYPWFAKREFVDYLNHVGLGHVPKLSRVEWGVIRSSLGRPRRLSQQFLREEREKLARYRESVRAHYTHLRSGIMKEVPSDLARPLRVGQRVIARHSKTRGIHNGHVLTVERNRCRVQFDLLELGVEFVMDVDCMPSDMADNMPEAFTRENVAVEKDRRNINESIHAKMLVLLSCSPSEDLERADDSFGVSSSAQCRNPSLNLAKEETIGDTLQDNATCSNNDSDQQVTQSHYCNLGCIRSRDADVQVLSDLSRALDKKKVLVLELNYMNYEFMKSQHGGVKSLKDSEVFRSQYASVLKLLKETNDQVSFSLLYLKKCNIHGEILPRPWLKPVLRSNNLDERHCYSTVPAQGPGSIVVKVVESSRQNAQKMVDVAAQAMSSSKEDEDAYTKIVEALGYTNGWVSGVPATKSFKQLNQNHGLRCPDGAIPVKAEQRMTDRPADSNLNNASEAVKVQIPSALISSCVATLLMIQACADSQYPPSDAADILENALRSLQPCCPQNVPIYRDIQMCMGMVKNQILALIPT